MSTYRDCQDGHLENSHQIRRPKAEVRFWTSLSWRYTYCALCLDFLVWKNNLFTPCQNAEFEILSLIDIYTSQQKALVMGTRLSNPVMFCPLERGSMLKAGGTSRQGIVLLILIHTG